jgi:hypothetical protein
MSNTSSKHRTPILTTRQHQHKHKPDTNTHHTPQPSTPIERAGSKHQTGFPTIKHITPQPSTPIERAGSDY